MSDTVDERAERLAKIRAAWAIIDGADGCEAPFLLAELDRVTAERDHAQGCFAAEQEITRVTLQSIRKLTAERDALRAQVDELADSEALIAERDEEIVRAEAAEARLQAVRKLHAGTVIEDFPECRTCGVFWPCPTVKALGGYGQEAGQ